MKLFRLKKIFSENSLVLYKNRNIKKEVQGVSDSRLPFMVFKYDNKKNFLLRILLGNIKNSSKVLNLYNETSFSRGFSTEC